MVINPQACAMNKICANEKPAKAKSPCLLRYRFPLQSEKAVGLEHISSIYLYSDLAKHQLVGNTSAQLLDIIPLLGRDSASRSITQHYYLVQQPYYMPIAKEEFDQVEIQLNTEWGTPFPFINDANTSVVCRLHFRRRNLISGGGGGAHFII